MIKYIGIFMFTTLAGYMWTALDNSPINWNPFNWDIQKWLEFLAIAIGGGMCIGLCS